MRFFSVFFLALVAVLGISAIPARALELAPAIIERAADPGSTIKASLKVTNDEGADRTYYFSIQKFVPSGENGQQDFLPLTDTSGLPSWLYLGQPSTTLRAGESLTIPVEIRIPSTARPGGYYAAIFLSTLPPQAVTSGTTQVVARTGALVILRVNGAVTESYSIERFALDGASFHRLPVPFALTIRNTGDVHLAPRGHIDIKNVFGKVIASLPVNPQGSRVLPSSSRRLSVVWDHENDTPPGGFWHEVKAEWQQFAIGPYKAELVMEGPMSGAKPAPLSFNVWPWHLAIAALLIVMMLLIIARLYRSWIIRLATASKS